MKCVNAWWIPDDAGMRDRSNPADTKGLEHGQIELALKHCRDRKLVVQGGARVGVWPKALASVFERVIAFEPDPDNFTCCELNLADVRNIELRPAALAQIAGVAMLRRSLMSGGEHYLEPRGPLYRNKPLTPDYRGEQPVQTVAIDDLRLPECSAIFLDVEGLELKVLEGAADTLRRLRPVLVLEENQCGARYGVRQGELARHLGELYGYRLVDQWTTLPPEVQNDGYFHGADLIFA